VLKHVSDVKHISLTGKVTEAFRNSIKLSKLLIKKILFLHRVVQILHTRGISKGVYEIMYNENEEEAYKA